MKRAASGLNRHPVALASASVAGVAALVAFVAARRKGIVGPGEGGSPLAARATTTIACPAEEVYRSWRNFESLPAFMDHLESVKDIDGRTSHWVAHGPAGTTVAWKAEIVEDVVGEVIAWRSVEGADVDNAGSVRFSPAPKGQGTEVTLELDYVLPGRVLASSMNKCSARSRPNSSGMISAASSRCSKPVRSFARMARPKGFGRSASFVSDTPNPPPEAPHNHSRRDRRRWRLPAGWASTSWKCKTFLIPRF